MDKKFEAFQFHTITIDGHNFDEMEAAFKEARQTKGKPTAIIANTIKGKGVSFAENVVDWHISYFTKEMFDQAMEELG